MPRPRPLQIPRRHHAMESLLPENNIFRPASSLLSEINLPPLPYQSDQPPRPGPYSLLSQILYCLEVDARRPIVSHEVWTPFTFSHRPEIACLLSAKDTEVIANVFIVR